MTPLPTEPSASEPSELPEITAREEGALLRVRAAPGASRDRVAGLHANALKVAVCAAPERGKANQAIIRVLAKALGLRRSQLSVRSGSTSRDKQLLVEGVNAAELAERVRNALPGR